LFSPGEEAAIADYAGIMADAEFPLTPEFLRHIVQGIVNEGRYLRMVKEEVL